MRYLILCILFFLFSCRERESESMLIGNTMVWIVGDWIRENEEAGKVTYEKWSRADDLTFIGHGYTIQNNDTIFNEDLKLINTGDEWELQVSENNKSRIRFLVTEQEVNNFTAENPSHDFPNTIKYYRDGDKLRAQISGKEISIDFEFKRQGPFQYLD